MCKELPVILVNKVVDPKRIIGKIMEGLGGGEAQGVADPKKHCKTMVKWRFVYRRATPDM
jgi:hypothetical protein